jgi:hypothetical protein
MCSYAPRQYVTFDGEGVEPPLVTQLNLNITREDTILVNKAIPQMQGLSVSFLKPGVEKGLYLRTHPSTYGMHDLIVTCVASNLSHVETET